MSDITPARLRRGYGPIYRRLSRCGTEMGAPSKLVLMNLMERMGQTSKVWPTQDTIAEDTGLTRQTVNEALGKLKDAGFVTVVRQGQGKPNIYSLELPLLLDWAESVKATSRSRLRRPLGVSVADSFYKEEQTIEEQGATRAFSRKTTTRKRMPSWIRDYPRSDESEDERNGDSKVEQWLLLEMIEQWGESAVKAGLARFGDHFSLWRKAKDLQEDNAYGSLRECLTVAEVRDQIDRENVVELPHFQTYQGDHEVYETTPATPARHRG